MRIVPAALLAALAAACARPDDRVVTAAGQTYVVFHAVDAACVRDGIVREFVDHAWAIRTTTDSRIVAQQRAPAWINTAVLLTRIDPPQVRMTVTIVPDGGDVKALIESGVLLDPLANQERVEAIPTTPQMAAVFNNSVHRIDQACRR
ncbi:MAG: hypothetical protein ISP49_17435 [Reyranella sp.]|jgi:hypothetical protein|nr:hypothetical protein [Reyranella sp.]MBL6653384.1 hypothetical protein [Reyranella sp.]